MVHCTRPVASLLGVVPPGSAPCPWIQWLPVFVWPSGVTEDDFGGTATHIFSLAVHPTAKVCQRRARASRGYTAIRNDVSFVIVSIAKMFGLRQVIDGNPCL